MRAIAITLAVLMSAGSAAGQEAAPPAKTQVLVLATYHFHNPGADVARFSVADHRSEPRQREIAAVVDALARYRPTKILVEWTPDTADTLAATYARYRAGSFALTANEVHQIGFRLASRLGHDALYPVDYSRGLPMDSLMAYAREHDPAFLARFGALIAQVEATMARWQREEGGVPMLFPEWAAWREMVAANPGMSRRLTEELLRLVTPTRYLGRHATEDVDLSGESGVPAT